jgi:hypothetical protein
MVGVSQYSQILVPVLLYISCHIISVNTQCETYFQIKSIRYSQTKLTVHQYFMSRAILEVTPPPPDVHLCKPVSA